MIIAIDFDGTLVKHDYPRIGEDIGAFEWLTAYQNLGARLVLFTMRDGAEFRAAVVHCQEKGLKLYGLNTNPRQREWTMSPKAYAHLYIDDAAFGVPLVSPPNGVRPWVDWSSVGPEVLAWCQRGGRPEKIVDRP